MTGKNRYSGRYWVIFRVDFYEPVLTSEQLGNVRVTVKEIVADMETADREVERLNNLNAGKDCHYFVALGRLYEESERPSNENGPEPAVT